MGFPGAALCVVACAPGTHASAQWYRTIGVSMGDDLSWDEQERANKKKRWKLRVYVVLACFVGVVAEVTAVYLLRSGWGIGAAACQVLALLLFSFSCLSGMRYCCCTHKPADTGLILSTHPEPRFEQIIVSNDQNFAQQKPMLPSYCTPTTAGFYQAEVAGMRQPLYPPPTAVYSSSAQVPCPVYQTQTAPVQPPAAGGLYPAQFYSESP